MIPTAAGQRLLDDRASVLAELERTESAVRDLGTQPAGCCCASRPSATPCYHWLPPVLHEFTARVPRTWTCASTSTPRAARSRRCSRAISTSPLMLSPVRNRRLCRNAARSVTSSCVRRPGAAPVRESAVRCARPQLARREHVHLLPARGELRVSAAAAASRHRAAPSVQHVQLTEAHPRARARRPGRVGAGAVGRAAVPGSPVTHRRAADAARLLQGLDRRRAARAGGDAVRGRVPAPHCGTRAGRKGGRDSHGPCSVQSVHPDEIDADPGWRQPSERSTPAPDGTRRSHGAFSPNCPASAGTGRCRAPQLSSNASSRHDRTRKDPTGGTTSPPSETTKTWDSPESRSAAGRRPDRASTRQSRQNRSARPSGKPRLSVPDEPPPAEWPRHR